MASSEAVLALGIPSLDGSSAVPFGSVPGSAWDDFLRFFARLGGVGLAGVPPVSSGGPLLLGDSAIQVCSVLDCANTSVSLS